VKQKDEPVEYFPASQSTQTDTLLFTTLVEYFSPAGHRHAADSAVEKEPVGHDSPHAAAEVAPTAAENLPAEHGEQTENVNAAILDEYVPAGQSVQAADDDDGAYCLHHKQYT